MKQYELLVIFKPNADSDEIEKLIAKVVSDIEALEGTADNVDKIGRKKLAYEIQGYRDGYFCSIILSLQESSVAAFKRQLRLNESILRTMFYSKTTVKAGV